MENKKIILNLERAVKQPPIFSPYSPCSWH